MTLEAFTQVRPPPGLRGVPPRYQVFDRRKDPPMTVGQFYFDPAQGGVVFEVYDDFFREFLQLEPALAGKRFDWMLDVDPGAPRGTRAAIVEPHPMPVPVDHGRPADAALTLEDAIAVVSAPDYHRVIRTSDPR